MNIHAMLRPEAQWATMQATPKPEDKAEAPQSADSEVQSTLMPDSTEGILPTHPAPLVLPHLALPSINLPCVVHRSVAQDPFKSNVGASEVNILQYDKHI